MHPERRRRFSDKPATVLSQPLTQPQPDHTSLESASPCAPSTPWIRSMGYAPLEVLAAKADLPFSGKNFFFPTSPTAFSSTMAQELLNCIPAPFADDRTAFTDAVTGFPIWTNIVRAALKWAYSITPAVGGDPRFHADEGRVHLVWLLSSTLPVSCICKTGAGALPDLITSTIKFFQLHSSARAAHANGTRPLQVPNTPGTASAHTGKTVGSPAVRLTNARSDETKCTEKRRQLANATSAIAQPSADSKNPCSKVLRNATDELEDVRDALSEKSEATRLDKIKKKEKKEKKGKKKKARAVEASGASSAATAAIDQPSVEVTKSKKRKHRDEEEDVSRKKVKQHKAQSSMGAAVEAATAVTLGLDPKGKGPAKSSQPASAPTKKMMAASSSTPTSVFPSLVAPRKVQPSDTLAENLNGRRASGVYCASDSSTDSSSDSSSKDDVTIPAQSAVSLVLKQQRKSVSSSPPVIKEETPDAEPEVQFMFSHTRRSTDLPLRPTPTVRRPEPTVDLSKQEKEGKVFTVDVLEDLLQEEVNENKLLRDVLGHVGIGEMKLRIIKKRIDKHKDSIANACRAADVEPKAKRARREVRS